MKADYIYRRTGAALLALTLLLCAGQSAAFAAAEAAPAEAEETETVSVPEKETVYLSAAEDLLKFAENCALDNWSQGRTVVLEQDISLTGVEFRPIPGFGGVFDGRGHSVSGLDLSGSYAQAGFFAVLRAGAEVKSLTVIGEVSPSGDSACVGGIVGENHGLLRGCTFLGTVRGDRSVGGLAGINASDGIIENSRASGGVYGTTMTGGVAGSNYGEIDGCGSECFVNTQSSDPSLSLDDLDADLNRLFARGTATGALNLVTDSGGVAGFSSGTLQACTNYGTVGYPHTGYNVGGIAGRSSGFVTDCVNRGSVYGRKDVGGVVGQAEPHVEITVGAESLEDLYAAIDELGRRVDAAAASAEGSTAAVNARLNAVRASVTQASDSAKALSDGLLSYAGDTVEEVNRVSATLTETLPRLRGVAESLTGAADGLSTGLNQTDSAVNRLENADPYVGEVTDALRGADENLRAGARLWDAASGELSAGIQSLSGTVSVDPEQQAAYDAARADLREQLDPNRAGGADKAPSYAWYLRALAEDLRSRDLATVLERDLPGLRAAQAQTAADLDTVSRALRFEDENARRGMDQIAESFRMLDEGQPGVDYQGVIGYFTAAAESLSAVYPALDGLAAEGQAAAGDLDAALWSFASSADALSGALGDGAGILTSLETAGTPSLPSPGPALEDASGDVFRSLDAVGSQLGLLNGDLSGASGALLSSLRSVNSQMTAVMDLLAQAVNQAGDYSLGDVVSDVSEEELDSVTLGKLRSCINYGEISGDLSVGGVAGTLGVDDALDPEGDAMGTTVSTALRREYALKAIVQTCVNRGTVTAKRDFAGCVCGSMELGVLTGCEAYGSAESLSGSYVGGLAGWCAAVIRDSWAKCTLAGDTYIGGVLGGGSGCTATGCTAMVEIGRSRQYAGAVAGGEAGTIENNRFVSDTLAGIDRFSYSGRAEPIAYAALRNAEALPEDFKKLTLRFVAEGDVVKTLAFDYGATLDASAFPEVPPKAGCYGGWDRTELADLRFDTTVSAVYQPLLTAIPSEALRTDGRPVFLAEGGFQGTDRVAAESAEILALSDQELLETWRVNIPEDGAERHVLRYLPPENARNYELRLLREGGWHRLNAENAGSYLLLEVEGNEAVLALVQRTAPGWLQFLLGGAVALLAVLLFLLRRRAKRRKAVPASAAALTGAVPPTEGKTAPTEETERTIGEEKAETPSDPAAEKKAARRAARKSRRRVFRAVLLALLLLLGAGVAAVVRYAPGLIDGAAAYSLLRLYLQRPAADMTLTLELPEGPRPAEAALFWREADGRRVSGAEFRDFTVYYADGMLLMPGGQAFSLSDPGLDRTALAPAAADLFRWAQAEREDRGELRYYRLALTPEQARSLAERCLPEAADSLTQLLRGENGGAVLTLTVEEGAPEAVSFTLAGEDGAEAFRAELRLLKNLAEREIPAEVRTALQSETAPASGGDGWALLSAWLDLSRRELSAFRTELQADCGPLTVRESPELAVRLLPGRELCCLRSNLFSLYFEDGKLYTERGQELTDRTVPLAGELPGIVGKAVAAGEFSHETRSDGTEAYSMNLDSEAVAEAVYAIAPAARELSLSFDSGSAEVLLSGGAVTRFSLRCSGQVRVAGLNLSASFSAALTPDETLAETFTFPEVLLSREDARS